MRRATQVVSAAIVCAFPISAPAQSEPPAERVAVEVAPTCEDLSFSVVLGPDASTAHTVAGTLCGRGEAGSRTVQVLLSGATYTRQYWDLPIEAPRYSYVAAQTLAGFVTLSLDRIGMGESGRPPALDVTVAANAHVVHQIVTRLRAGGLSSDRLGVVQPERVLLVGHSLGSAVAAAEAATYGDVDGVILSGVLHARGPDVLALAGALYPASLDLAFSAEPPPEGYLTTLPGERGRLFYREGRAEPDVIALDEVLKGTVTLGELGDASQAAASTPRIGVPVLLAIGDEDFTFCTPPSCRASGVLQREAQFFSPEACLTTFALPRAGHALNLHRTAPIWYAAAALWATMRVGASGSSPPVLPCRRWFGSR